MSDLVKVAVPKGTVYLAPKLTVPMGAAAMAVLNMAPDGVAQVQAAITGALFGPSPSGCIVAWDGARFQKKNDEGIVVPEDITTENIERLLPWTEGGADIAEKIEELYTGDLFRPLEERRKKSLPPMQMEPSTSQTIPSGSERPKRSRSSSQNGTAGLVSVAPVP